jgi:uncharacterized membrane protein YgdD (TMEM256/DUF423 family)
MAKIFLSIAGILGGLAVAAGAFGSHPLREKLSDRSLEIFETGVRYHMYHALALLLVALLISQTNNPTTPLIVAGCLFIAGIFIFSGSLYALSLTGIKYFGAITPLGGVAFIAAWLTLALAPWSLKS